MTDNRPDAVSELVAVLRDQVARKDERIAALETLLQQAGEQIEEQQKSIQALAAAAHNSGAASGAHSGHVAASFRPAVSHEPQIPAEKPPAQTARILLPDLGPQIEVIARAVISTAEARRENAVSDESAPIERDTGKLKLQEAAGARRGWRLWRSRSRAAVVRTD